MTAKGRGKTLLLTGGTGFIGRFLVPALLADGWRVVVLSRQNKAAVEKLLGPEVRSIGSLDQWGESEGPDACINLAGEGILDRRWSSERKAILRESRIDLTRDLVGFLNHFPAPPDVFLSGSAVGFYGVERGDAPLSEQEPPGADFAAQLCKDWEQEARNISDKSRLCLLRTGVVLHRLHGALARMLPPFFLGLGGPMGTGRQIMPWIHIQDVVGGIIHLLTGDACGAFNFAAPGSCPNRHFVQGLGRALRRPAVLPLPGFAVRALLGEGSVLLLKGQRPVPEALIGSGYAFAFPELDCALGNLFD